MSEKEQKGDEEPKKTDIDVDKILGQTGGITQIAGGNIYNRFIDLSTLPESERKEFVEQWKPAYKQLKLTEFFRMLANRIKEEIRAQQPKTITVETEKLTKEIESDDDTKILAAVKQDDKALRNIGDILRPMANDIIEIGRRMNKRAEAMNTLLEKFNSQGISREKAKKEGMKLANFTAKDLNRYVKKMDTYLPKLEESIKILNDNGIFNYIAWTKIQTQNDRNNLEVIRISTQFLADSTKGALEESIGFWDALKRLLDSSLNKKMKDACQKAIRNLEAVISVFEAVDIYSIRNLIEVERKLNESP